MDTRQCGQYDDEAISFMPFLLLNVMHGGPFLKKNTLSATQMTLLLCVYGLDARLFRQPDGNSSHEQPVKRNFELKIVPVAPPGGR